jgi:hypothetical protein
MLAKIAGIAASAVDLYVDVSVGQRVHTTTKLLLGNRGVRQAKFSSSSNYPEHGIR